MPTPQDLVSRIEWGVLEGGRPRRAGKNARLPEHGSTVKVPICRLTTSTGAQGIGLSRLDESLARQALGLPISTMFSEEVGTDEPWMAFDFALWDLSGKSAGVPVYELIGSNASASSHEPVSVACYDTSLYFDDLLGDAGENDHRQGAEIVAKEAAWGYEQGHRSFKVKVGRGARWMAPRAGLERDIAVVAAVRDAIGPSCTLLADANNGYTLNIAKEFLDRTSSAQLGWLEEPFHEDGVLLEALHEWTGQLGLGVLVADGESASAEECYKMAAEGWLDVVQCDILAGSFSRWLQLGPRLDELQVASAPHHYGLHLGNYVAGHLAGAVRDLRYVEWDQTTTAGVSAPGYTLDAGRVQLSAQPGFGIELDETVFARAVQSSGFDLRLSATA
ncbi:MAG TPA: enolase C-terminal domain-like protein [Acidimicrobiales bacterium]|nr:enolase C-terminal domain-like protein [Acidimicrobiales bacterium]